MCINYCGFISKCFELLCISIHITQTYIVLLLLLTFLAGTLLKNHVRILSVIL